MKHRLEELKARIGYRCESARFSLKHSSRFRRCGHQISSLCVSQRLCTVDTTYVSTDSKLSQTDDNIQHDRFAAKHFDDALDDDNLPRKQPRETSLTLKNI